MENDKDKTQRNQLLIKGFMILVIFHQVVLYFDYYTLDFGAIAGASAILAMLRALLASPILLATPIRLWLSSNITINRDSKRYLSLAVILLIIALF